MEEEKEKAYSEMREAIAKKDHQRMQRILENPYYDPNRAGGIDKRTALHTAAQLEDKVALKILLGQRDIDTNVKTTACLTPLLLAAAKGKMVSIEILLADSRVDENAIDDMDQTAEELVAKPGRNVATLKVKELLSKRNPKPQEGIGKLAILIGNSNYQRAKRLTDLEGAKADLEAMKAKLSAEGYRVEVIKNSADILNDVGDVMKNTADRSVTHLQVLYAGESPISKLRLLDIFFRSWGPQDTSQSRDTTSLHRRRGCICNSS